MKNLKLIIVLMLVFGFGILSAQTEKGKFLVGASSNLGMDGFFPSMSSSLFDVGILTMKSKYEHDGQRSEDYSQKMNSFNFNPKIGYFALKNLSLGLKINFSRFGNNDEDYKSHNSFYGAGPFLRYYIPTSKVFPFLELYGTMGNISSVYKHENEATQREKENFQSYGGGIGLAFPLGEKATFDGVLGYDAFIMSEEEEDYKSSLIISNIGLKLGFTLLLGKK